MTVHFTVFDPGGLDSWYVQVTFYYTFVIFYISLYKLVIAHKDPV